MNIYMFSNKTHFFDFQPEVTLNLTAMARRYAELGYYRWLFIGRERTG
jgi:hypothetical protein